MDDGAASLLDAAPTSARRTERHRGRPDRTHPDPRKRQETRFFPLSGTRRIDPRRPCPGLGADRGEARSASEDIRRRDPQRRPPSRRPQQAPTAVVAGRARPPTPARTVGDSGGINRPGRKQPAPGCPGGGRRRSSTTAAPPRRLQVLPGLVGPGRTPEPCRGGTLALIRRLGRDRCGDEAIGGGLTPKRGLEACG